ncbi:hypothetical protein BpHYR1_045459 [Brachionus plicatilis]|uniref:Uncharacterized protein n=1 Tax=Brachionus plicatilis TaxID=10195 RepID=A0A3M7T4F7_BRAPC|nr:hypothetical protein BpHYR1_045459 [Brachionus plicatilis]
MVLVVVAEDTNKDLLINNIPRQCNKVNCDSLNMKIFQVCIFFLIITGLSSESLATNNKPLLLEAIINSVQNEFQMVRYSRQNGESKIQINPNYIEKDALNPQLIPPKAQID